MLPTRHELERRLQKLEQVQAEKDNGPYWVAHFCSPDSRFLDFDGKIVERMPGETDLDVFYRVYPNPRPMTFYAIYDAKEQKNGHQPHIA